MTGLPRRVLAIGAHPDDIELLCAGTLAKFLLRGSEVRLAVACRGDRGGRAGPGPALSALRQEEARRSAEILGAPIRFLDLGDADVRDAPEVRLKFLDLLRAEDPDLVITHGPTDYHDDHVRVGDLAAKCTWFAASPGHRSDHPPIARPPALAYMDTVASIAFEPTHLVDITETVEIKRRMLACHRSQLARDDSGMNALEDLADAQARLRGFQCGVRFAEAFRTAPLWGRRRAEPLFP